MRLSWVVLVAGLGLAAGYNRLEVENDLQAECFDAMNEDMIRDCQNGVAVECRVAAGHYTDNFFTSMNGEKGCIIKIACENGAVLHPTGEKDRMVEQMHSYHHWDNCEFDGQGKAATLMMILGIDRKKKISSSDGDIDSSVTGVRITDCHFHHATAECMHLRYFTTYTEVTGCDFHDCGMKNFGEGCDDGKVGECIYIGTSISQWDDGKHPHPERGTDQPDKPDYDPDRCQFNHIHNNNMKSNGNECSEVKENSRYNLIEYNTCSHQMDPNSGGFSCRGEHNTFRYNEVRDCVGAGIRLGSDDNKNYGHSNNVYGNKFEGNGQGNGGCGQGKGRVGVYNTDNQEQNICGNEGNDDGACDAEYDAGWGGIEGGGDEDDEDQDEEDRDTNEGWGGGAVENEEDRSWGGGEEDSDEDSDEDKLGAGSCVGCQECATVSDIIATRGDGTKPQNLLDGYFSTRWSSNKKNAWVVLSLPEPTRVCGFSLAFFRGRNRVDFFKVKVEDEDGNRVPTGYYRSDGNDLGMQTWSFDDCMTITKMMIIGKQNAQNKWMSLTEAEICMDV